MLTLQEMPVAYFVSCHNFVYVLMGVIGYLVLSKYIVLMGNVHWDLCMCLNCFFLISFLFTFYPLLSHLGS